MIATELHIYEPNGNELEYANVEVTDRTPQHVVFVTADGTRVATNLPYLIAWEG